MSIPCWSIPCYHCKQLLAIEWALEQPDLERIECPNCKGLLSLEGEDIEEEWITYFMPILPKTDA